SRKSNDPSAYSPAASGPGRSRDTSGGRPEQAQPTANWQLVPRHLPELGLKVRQLPSWQPVGCSQARNKLEKFGKLLPGQLIPSTH
uniref:RBPJ-interacting and tubulin-associated protein n=1 Tax=Macrostomum lignano TaxID=282301 RepID=A0A1I8FPY6_9PLAT